MLGQPRLEEQAAPVAGGLGQPRCLDIHLVDEMLHVVVGLGDGGRTEGVGLDQVGTRCQVLFVDFLDDLRLGQHQQFVVALHVVREVGESRSAVFRLAQLVALDHRTHGAIEDQDAPCKLLAKGGEDLGFWKGHGAMASCAPQARRRLRSIQP